MERVEGEWQRDEEGSGHRGAQPVQKEESSLSLPFFIDLFFFTAIIQQHSPYGNDKALQKPEMHKILGESGWFSGERSWTGDGALPFSSPCGTVVVLDTSTTV